MQNMCEYSHCKCIPDAPPLLRTVCNLQKWPKLFCDFFYTCVKEMKILSQITPVPGRGFQRRYFCHVAATLAPRWPQAGRGAIHAPPGPGALPGRDMAARGDDPAREIPARAFLTWRKELGAARSTEQHSVQIVRGICRCSTWDRRWTNRGAGSRHRY